MRYLMQQRVFTLGEQFTIENELGEEVARIDARLFSFGDKLSFTDVLGHELARIEQRLMSWGPTYEIYRDGLLTAVVKKQVLSFRPHFTVERVDGTTLTIEGEWTEHEYTFVRDDRAVATVSKSWWALADSYGVELLESEDAVTILAATVAIDMIDHQGDR